ncbi:MAG: tripartite tricarboxylate transporter substrate binding protein [Clostridia bacterium]|nr:tripartite tricarboxylate transporter substrate binding protein [Clostridia bacterium]
MKKLLAVALLVFAFGVLCRGAFAAYPEKPVEVIVAMQAGGGTDIAARTLFKYAEKYFGQSFAVINKPGASGEIGWTAIAKANPDGYTIGFINPPSFLMVPIMRKGCRYKLEDFDLIANIVLDPGVIGVLPKSPYKSLPELMAAIQKEPKSIDIAYTGPGTSEALLLSRIEKQTGAEFNKVPFDGSAPGMVALMGGNVDAVTMNVSECHTYIHDGNLRLLAVGSAERDPAVPNVPTYTEAGYPYIQVAMRGVAAPKGIPEEALKALESAIERAVNDPEFQAKAKELQMPLHFMGSVEYTKFLRDINVDLRQVWATNPW